MDNKIYIVVDESIWNDESNVNVVCATENINIAKQKLKQYIEEVKKEVNFNNLDAIRDYDDLDYNDVDGEFIFEESEDKFSLFQNGEYNSNHIYISIFEKELTKEYEINKEIEM